MGPKVIKKRLTQHTNPPRNLRLPAERESFMGIASAAHVCFSARKAVIHWGIARASSRKDVYCAAIRATWPKSVFGFDFGPFAWPNLCTIPLSTLLFLHGFYDRTPKYSRGRVVYPIAV